MYKQRKVAIAHLGARKHYQEPILLHKWGILDTFYTDFYARNNLINQLLRNPQIYRRLPKSLKKMLDRYVAELNQANIVDFPLLGINFALTRRQNISSQKWADEFMIVAQKFGNLILKKGLGKANVLYGFNSTSLEVFEYAKSKGIKCVLDQVVAECSYRNTIMLEEEQIWDGWSKSPFIMTESIDQRIKRESKEHQLADHIICGSEFVKSSLVSTGVEAEKITVISLGTIKNDNVALQADNIGNNQKKNEELKILFAGEVGLRKGIPYLLESLKLIKNQIPFTCKIAGQINLRTEKLQQYNDVCEFLGRIPRSEMTNLYQWADVFVFPSICEGSAMVTYEALISGLPIITTYNSGSIIRDGIDGFIVPIRNSQAIGEKLMDVYNGKLNNTSLMDRQKYCES
ncbi:MAG: glycosyltransferase family 4 protein, partial [Cyanobacteria bacterium]|nr:glycosyltransferase family 4 protein [Cyanobacteria bacterium CG_2015-16_32_12]